MLSFQIVLWIFISLVFLLAYSCIFVSLRNGVILGIKNKKLRDIGKCIIFFISYGGVIYALYKVIFDNYTMDDWIFFNAVYIIAIMLFIAIIGAFVMLYESYKSEA